MAAKKLKELRPGVYGTPGAFSKELLDSLPMEYRPPKGGKFNVNLKFLRWLSKNKLTHITLNYSTNLSKIVHRNINIIDLLASFKHVNLAISVDGYGKAVEYSRHGFKWDKFLENLNY